MGAEVAYHDPYVPAIEDYNLSATRDLAEALDGADVAVIVTAHPAVGHGAVVRLAPAVADLRGIVRHLASTAPTPG